MRILFTLNILLLASHFLVAQVSLNAAHGNAKSTSGNVNFSIGQMLTQTLSTKGAILTEGIHQPYEISSTLSTSTYYNEIQLSYYPNPVSDVLRLNNPNFTTKKLQFNLFDINGRALKTGTLDMALTQINFSDLPASTYLLKIYSTDQIVKVFTILKK